MRPPPPSSARYGSVVVVLDLGSPQRRQVPVRARGAGFSPPAAGCRYATARSAFRSRPGFSPVTVCLPPSTAPNFVALLPGVGSGHRTRRRCRTDRSARRPTVPENCCTPNNVTMPGRGHRIIVNPAFFNNMTAPPDCTRADPWGSGNSTAAARTWHRGSGSRSSRQIVVVRADEFSCRE